ncbi:MAG: hypothetical protein HZB38_11795 [Planctomycetes bacterium]|nr:hypothetical protein [Planctomycetota bacterium]
MLQTRKPPLGCVQQGDGIGFKISGGEMIGVWRATWVREYHDLRPTDVDALRREFNRWICAPASYWRERRRSRYAVLIGIEPANLSRARITPPRLFGTAWVHMLGGSLKRAASRQP